jgi:GntR family transcriptional regulator
LNIILTNTANMPTYEQIKEQIKAAILRGELQEGEQLPSIRGLARDLQISVITTMRAYNDLEQEGFVTNIQGKGCYVQPQSSDFLREHKLVEIEEHLQAAVAAARLCKLSDSELIRMVRLFWNEEDDHA